jgi:hypothetical protein
MSQIRVRLVIATLWLLSLFAVGTFVHAQPQNRGLFAGPTLFSSGDLGFQAFDTGGKTVVGKLVVRVNGQWKDAEFAPGPRVQPLTAK